MCPGKLDIPFAETLKFFFLVVFGGTCSFPGHGTST